MDTTHPSLLQRLRQGNHGEDWARFVDLYTPLLLHWALRLGLREQDATDLVQNVFTLLVRKLPTFEYDQQQSFRGWLRVVLRNVWRDQTRRAALPVEDNGDGVDRAAVPDGLDDFVEEEYRQYLAGRALELMRAQFQPTTWKACWEHVVRGRTAEDVAAELGLSTNAVYLATSRVLRRLRQELQGLFE